MAEEQKRKFEEQKAKAAELKQQKEEAEKARIAKLKASNLIRQAVMKVAQSTIDTYDEMRNAYEAVLADELDNCGDTREKVFEENEKIAEVARKRIEGIREKKAEDDRAKKEVEDKKKEKEEKAQSLLKELVSTVETAEGGVERLKANVENYSNETEILPALAAARWEKIEELFMEAGRLVQFAQEFMDENREAMKPPPVTKLPPKLAAKQLALEDANANGEEKVEKLDFHKVVADVHRRITECQKAMAEENTTAGNARTLVETRAAAFASQDKIRGQFRRYDRMKNGLLFKRDVINFAKGEYAFELSEEMMETFWHRHSTHSVKHGEAGVNMEDFEDLRTSIGIVRELERDQKRRKVSSDA